MQSNNKRILFLINSLGRGGAEKIFLEQSKVLSQKGFAVQLKTLYGDFGFRRFMDWKGILALYQFIRKENIRIIYSTLDESNLVSRMMKLLNPGLRVVIREANDPRRKSWKFKLADICFNFLIYKIMAVSSGVAESLKSYQWIYKNKIGIVENGINLADIDYDKIFEKKSDSELTMLNVGNLTEQKNQIALLKIFKEMIESEDLPIKLVIAGEGKERPKLEKYIRDNLLQDKITLLGSVTREKVQELYLKSHITVSSSLWEGFPNSLLEAGAYGLPTVSLKTFGAEDLIKDGVNGFLVALDEIEELGDKIKILAQNRQMRYDMGLKAMEIIQENYSMEKNIDKLIALLK